MEGLISLLVYALLFYLLMRFGCGAHMIHGHHGGHEGSGHPDGKFIDPVCGKEIESDQGYGVMYEGNLYRFCSRQCLDQFDSQRALFAHKHHAVETEVHHEQ